MAVPRTQTGLWLAVAAAVAVIACAAVWKGERHGFIPISGTDAIDIPLASIQPGEARFFSYHGHSGGDIRLIVARDDQGRVQAVLDACERCYPYHRGYRAAHDVLTCNFCGTSYRVGAMERGMAGCQPVKIPFRRVGQAIRIETAELERQSKLF
jgi:uncharacterized membrane protein